MINSSANEHVHSLVRLTINPLSPHQYSPYLFFISCCLFPIRGGVKVPLVDSGD